MLPRGTMTHDGWSEFWFDDLDAYQRAVASPEWAAMEQARPGYYALLRAGIENETEAERLARGTSGDTIPRGVPRPAAGPATVAAR